MVKPLTFKGDKKSKKRKRPAGDTTGKEDASTTTPPTSLQKPTPSSAAADDDSTWTSADIPSDIAGPILLAFASSSRPHCVACDANGKVFASEIENVFREEGGEAMMATAEPHDVRQVWVASRVGGAEGWGFKGHHGRYLGCDKFGVLSAHREAISAEESFLIAPHPTEPGAFSIQTSHSTYLTTSSPPKQPSSSSPPTSTTTTTLRADSPTPHPIHVRMQALHKTRLSASKEAKAREVISRKELEEMIGRRLEDEEVRRLKRARRDGGFHEAVLDVRVKGKHDKFAC